MRFRYRLLPYLYTLAHHAATTGTPVVRPLWWPALYAEELYAEENKSPATAGASERHAADADDAFLLGDSLLVAPVVGPGAAARTCPVPRGHWRQWWDGADAAAITSDDAGEGGVVQCAVAADRIPVFVRAGSVVPLDDGWSQDGGPCAIEGDVPDSGAAPAVSLDHAPRLLAFHCWPFMERARGVAYDDAGDGDGPWRRDEIEVTGAAPGQIALAHWRRQGHFVAPPRVRVVLHGLEVVDAAADGVAVPVRHGVVETGPFDQLSLTCAESEG
ncbi:MAG: hypothetical protein ACYDD4_05530 [Acidimicrobiales bacterium]